MSRDAQILWDALTAPHGGDLLDRLSLASIVGMASLDPANVPIIEAALEQNRMDRDDELDWLGERGGRDV